MLSNALHQFLRIVPGMRDVPKNWNEELRRALSDNLIRHGFDGRLELTDAGRTELTKKEEKPWPCTSMTCEQTTGA
ncbi:hypothetical protein [Pseudomonas sp.]|uniref:hypothetical protein n=1 Tax=Pseudomonas sp. TaxID=306 RepID=UPI003C37F3B3